MANILTSELNGNITFNNPKINRVFGIDCVMLESTSPSKIAAAMADILEISSVEAKKLITSIHTCTELQPPLVPSCTAAGIALGNCPTS